MTDQKVTHRQAINISLVLVVIVSSCFFIWQIWKQINQPTATPDPTQTSSPTLTPTAPLPNTDFFAVTTAETECYSGPDPSYELVTELPVHQPVMVLGKNSDAGDWFLMRWSSPDQDCWAPAYRLTPGFELASLKLVSTPLPPTSTPTVTGTSTTIFVFVEVSSTPRGTKSPKITHTPSPTITPTSTFTLTLTKPVIPSDTPTHTQTPTRTFTPTPTNTPTHTATATFTACVPPSSPNLDYTLSINKKEITLEWSSSDRATSYQLYRSTNESGFSPFGSAITQRTAQDTKQPNDTYSYYVVAMNACGTASSRIVDIQR